MEATLTINDIFLLYENTADVYAPGIYNEAIIYVEDLRDLTNGVYIENRNAVINILNQLPNDTKIQIDSSNYVYPDIAKAPIVIAQATPSHPILTELDRQAFIKPGNGFDAWTIALYNNNTEIVLQLEDYPIEYFNLMEARNPNPTTYNSSTLPITLLPPSPLPGYQFIGWFDSLGNQVTTIPIDSTGTIQLYAQWLANDHQITYTGNDTEINPASNIPEPTPFTYGENVKLSATIPLRNGYLFLNWNTQPDGFGQTFFPKETIEALTNDMILYAQWYQLPRPATTCVYTICNCCQKPKPRKKYC